MSRAIHTSWVREQVSSATSDGAYSMDCIGPGAALGRRRPAPAAGDRPHRGRVPAARHPRGPEARQHA